VGGGHAINWACGHRGMEGTWGVQTSGGQKGAVEFQCRPKTTLLGKRSPSEALFGGEMEEIVWGELACFRGGSDLHRLNKKKEEK